MLFLNYSTHLALILIYKDPSHLAEADFVITSYPTLTSENGTFQLNGGKIKSGKQALLRVKWFRLVLGKYAFGLKDILNRKFHISRRSSNHQKLENEMCRGMLEPSSEI